MGLSTTIRNAVKLANKITEDLQPEIRHYTWVSQTASGAPTYTSSVLRQALVEYKLQTIRTQSGIEVQSRATVTFLQPIIVGLKDKIVLPDGSSGPILSLGGFVDSGTSRPYVTMVYLG